MKKTNLFTSKITELILYLVIEYFSYYISLKLDLFAGYNSLNYQAFYKTIPVLIILSATLIIAIGFLETVNKSVFENVFLTLVVVAAIHILYMTVAFFMRQFAIPRSVLFLASAIQIILFLLINFLFISIIRANKKDCDILLICPEDYRERLVVKVLSNDIYKESLRYAIDPDICEDYMNYVENCDRVYLSDGVNSAVKDKVVSACISMDKLLYIVPKNFEIAIFNSDLVQVSDVPAFKVKSLYLSFEKMFIKRLFDLLLSIFCLIILSPVMLVIALVLLITQGRPVLFKQERLTKDNKVFNLYKFRSMRIDAEKKSGPIWASKDDPRATKVGRFLRRYWLDELPQLFNVLKGDMSLVGPRPERPHFAEEFAKTIPDFRYRLSVKAGVTGLAQVLGRYASTPEVKLKYDLIYIKNSSFTYDLKILLETAKKIVIGTLQRGEMLELSYNEMIKKHGYKVRKHKKVTEYKKNKNI